MELIIDDINKLRLIKLKMESIKLIRQNRLPVDDIIEICSVCSNNIKNKKDVKLFECDHKCICKKCYERAKVCSVCKSTKISS